MEREDQNRVSVGSLSDWLRVKNNYNSAAFHEINAVLEAEGLHNERDTILAHFSHVRFFVLCHTSHSSPTSSWTQHFQWPKPI
jgi:hypothetical protein